MQYQSIPQPTNVRIEKKYRGVIVPMVTPVTSDYKLDAGAVERILEHLYQHDVFPFIMGTTGESTSLSLSSRLEYLKIASKFKKSGSMLYAGISSNSMDESIEFAKHCFDSGIDAVAATLPSYYLLTETQIKKYFESLADAINGPLIIYNIPATTHMSIPLEIIDELSHHPNIVGTKDSERGESRLNESTAMWAKRKDFSHFVGWAAKSAHALLNGSDGLIPSTGNLHPGLYQDLHEAALTATPELAFKYQRYSDLIGDLYQSGRTLGESLWALKVLMEEYDLCKANVLPPLLPQCPETAQKLKKSLYDLIEKEGLQLKRPQ